MSGIKFTVYCPDRIEAFGLYRSAEFARTADRALRSECAAPHVIVPVALDMPTQLRLDEITGAIDDDETRGFARDLVDFCAAKYSDDGRTWAS